MISSVLRDDINKFYELGLLVNDNFKKLFDYDDIIKNENEFLFGYYIDGKLVGFIHISKLYEVIDIINIVVDKNLRRKKVASKLINYIISYFDDVDKIMLEVNENNKAAINLYVVNNFKVINKRNRYYGNDTALIMERDV